MANTTMTSLLHHLASHINEDKLQQMKFLLDDIISAGDLDTCKHARDVFTKLKEKSLVEEHNLELLEDLFDAMNLNHLILKVKEFKDRIASDVQVNDIPHQQAATLPDQRGGVNDQMVMTYSVKIPATNKLLNQLASDINEDKLKEMKFLLSDEILAADLDMCRNPRDIFTKLKQKCFIGEHKLEFLKHLFDQMNLNHLSFKVQEFKDRIASRGQINDIPLQQAKTLPAIVSLEKDGTFENKTTYKWEKESTKTEEKQTKEAANGKSHVLANETDTICAHGATSVDGLGANRLNILLLGSEWGSSKGGISTFNRQLAIHLAKQPNLGVFVYLAAASDSDKKDADKVNVLLIKARYIPGEMDPLLKLHLLSSELPSPDVVISHGRKFGTAAFFLKERFPRSNWVHFVHVDCEEMGQYKIGFNPVAENNQKDKKELELCKEADLVVAVGPRLEEKYSTSLTKAAKKVEIFYPGLSTEFLNLPQTDTETEQFHVYMFGRGAEEDFELKGFDVAGDAVGKLGTNYVLRAVCAPSGEEEKVRDYFLAKTVITKNQLYVHEYCNDRELLKEMMCKASVVLMPSRAEAFGLIGLEALSAGVPVLVSAVSGFGIVLKELPFGRTYVVEGDNPIMWAEKIRELRKTKRSKRNKEVELMRTHYGSKYQWEDQCLRLAKLFYK